LYARLVGSPSGAPTGSAIAVTSVPRPPVCHGNITVVGSSPFGWVVVARVGDLG
jgi:hypothetical protein